VLLLAGIAFRPNHWVFTPVSYHYPPKTRGNLSHNLSREVRKLIGTQPARVSTHGAAVTPGTSSVTVEHTRPKTWSWQGKVFASEKMGYYGWNPEILIKKIAPPQVVQSLEKTKRGGQLVHQTGCECFGRGINSACLNRDSQPAARISSRLPHRDHLGLYMANLTKVDVQDLVNSWNGWKLLE